jgi:hypothetical protein
MGLGRNAPAWDRPESAARGIAGSSGSETAPPLVGHMSGAMHDL